MFSESPVVWLFSTWLDCALREFVYIRRYDNHLVGSTALGFATCDRASVQWEGKILLGVFEIATRSDHVPR